MRPGEIWLTRLAYSDASGAKIRPVLFLVVDGQDGIVAAVTSAPPRTKTDHALAEWAEPGLSRPSTVRLLRLATLTEARLNHRLGRIGATDAAQDRGDLGNKSH